MAQIIEITGATGTPPYDIYVCDFYGTNCVLVSTVLVSIPPTISITLPFTFETAPAVTIKIIDNDECVTQKVIVCDDIGSTIINLDPITATSCFYDPLTGATYYVQLQYDVTGGSGSYIAQYYDTGTSSWIDLYYFTGPFDGQDNTINGLVINIPALSDFYDVRIIDYYLNTINLNTLNLNLGCP